MSADLYAAPQHVGHTHVAQVAPEATLAAPGGRSMHDRASELRRISLPRTWVNKGIRKGRVCYYTPALVRYVALIVGRGHPSHVKPHTGGALPPLLTKATIPSP